MRCLVVLLFTGLLLCNSSTDAGLSSSPTDLPAHLRLGWVSNAAGAPWHNALRRTPLLSASVLDRQGSVSPLTLNAGNRKTPRSLVAVAAGPRMDGFGATAVQEPKALKLESALQRRIVGFLGLPPTEERFNVSSRISPSGLARQEFREEERGLCKIRRYNPDMLRPTTIEGYFLASQRLAQVITAVSVLAFAILRTETSVDDAEKVKADAVKVRETLTKMGATFVKIGQVLANRPDIVRADYMDELTKLQDQVPSFPSDVAFDIMRTGFGCDPAEIFDNITPEPLAAASLGQVYKATLKKNGKQVAIKVQRPGVAEVQQGLAI